MDKEQSEWTGGQAEVQCDYYLPPFLEHWKKIFSWTCQCLLDKKKQSYLNKQWIFNVNTGYETSA